MSISGVPEEDAQGTVDKAIEVLFHLRAASSACGVTAIGRALGMPKSSVHRLLQSLARRGLVARDERGRYRLGVGLVALGLGALDREPVVAAARPVLEAAAARMGETFFLVCARAGGLVVLDKAEGTGFLRAAPQIGTSVPAHATAVGKLYLALAPQQVSASLRDDLAVYTDRTVTQPKSLEAQLAEIRARGHASNLDEWVQGLSVLAAPIWLRREMVGAVAMAAATPRFRSLADELGEAHLVARVVDAGKTIGRRLAEGASGTEDRLE